MAGRERRSANILGFPVVCRCPSPGPVYENSNELFALNTCCDAAEALVTPPKHFFRILTQRERTMRPGPRPSFPRQHRGRRQRHWVRALGGALSGVLALPSSSVQAAAAAPVFADAQLNACVIRAGQTAQVASEAELASHDGTTEDGNESTWYAS